MNVAEVNLVIERALPFKMAAWRADTSGTSKAREIERFIVESAELHAELEEAHHWLSKVIEDCADEIAAMTGYEALLPPKPRDRITREDKLEAKRKMQAQPFLAGAEAKRLRATVVRQIDRLKVEFDMVSRSYTVISGG